MLLLTNVYRFIKFALLKIKFFSLILATRKNIESIFEKSQDSILFITHNYSGGTAVFEKNYISEKSEDFIICRMISYTKNIVIKIERYGKSYYLKPDIFKKILFKNCNIKLHYFLNFFSKPVYQV